mmetsp:Transcript_25886/g.49067  ORF Transcript_25886/g.49067 Transcript_25886/m.49067 type:complete len:312 (+) Transcript_25886:110-1045(+)
MNQTSSSWLILLLLAPTTVVWSQTCATFVPIDVTGIGTDFTKLILEPNCPTETQKLPGQLHYHITTLAAVQDEMTLTGSDADVVTPILTARGLGIDLNDAWNGNGGVGVELIMGAGQLQELELYGVRDQVFVTDTAGGLREVFDEGVDNVLTITTTRSGTLQYTHKGNGGATVIDAPNAVLDIDINGADHDLRIVSCQGLEGVITGTGNELLVAAGEITSLQVTGLNNNINVHTDIPTENGCANVVLEGLSNECTDNADSDITAAVVALDCVGPLDYTVECSGAASMIRSAMVWWLAATTTAGLFLSNSIV